MNGWVLVAAELNQLLTADIPFTIAFKERLMLSIMLIRLYNISLCTVSFRGSSTVSSFCFSVFSFFESQALMRLQMQLLSPRILKKPTLSRSRVSSVPDSVLFFESCQLSISTLDVGVICTSRDRIIFCNSKS